MHCLIFVCYDTIWRVSFSECHVASSESSCVWKGTLTFDCAYCTWIIWHAACGIATMCRAVRNDRRSRFFPNCYAYLNNRAGYSIISSDLKECVMPENICCCQYARAPIQAPSAFARMRRTKKAHSWPQIRELIMQPARTILLSVKRLRPSYDYNKTILYTARSPWSSPTVSGHFARSSNPAPRSPPSREPEHRIYFRSGTMRSPGCGSFVRWLQDVAQAK